MIETPTVGNIAACRWPPVSYMYLQNKEVSIANPNDRTPTVAHFYLAVNHNNTADRKVTGEISLVLPDAWHPRFSLFLGIFSHHSSDRSVFAVFWQYGCALSPRGYA